MEFLFIRSHEPLLIINLAMLVLLGKGLLVILEWGQKVESDEGAQKEVEWRLVPFIRFNQQSPSCLSGATPHRQTPLNINMSQVPHTHKTGVELLFLFELNPLVHLITDMNILKHFLLVFSESKREALACKTTGIPKFPQPINFKWEGPRETISSIKDMN